MLNIADIRTDYKMKSLNEAEAANNPFSQFENWWQDAVNSEIAEINALTLATATTDGKPTARIVLLKGYDEKGFVFFTNYQSKKGIQLAENPAACMVFFWKELERQIRIEGSIATILPEESDDYFFSRPIGSRIGAWASPQSNVIDSRDLLEKNISKYEQQFNNENIPRPAHWGGYRLAPNLFEFWQGRSSRLHDRLQYSIEANGLWKMERLAP